MPRSSWTLFPWFCSAVLSIFVLAALGAQPPSPLELVRGLREDGQVELALEYIKELESQPLQANDKAALLLERAKCLLEAAEREPDEATRIGMAAEAREGLKTFVIRHPRHPRALEALLTDARLTSMDAQEQLNRARRIDIPPHSEVKEEQDARDAAMQKQKDEAKKARPMFLLAAKQFNNASAQLRLRLNDKTLDPLSRRALEREAFEAELAAGINQYNTAETYMPPQMVSLDEKVERNKLLEQAKSTFNNLAKGPNTNRTVWVARAWAAEVTYEQDDANAAAAEVAAILKANILEAEDGKRLARFFQLRRNFLTALTDRNLQKVMASETELRRWLTQYDNPRKPSTEVYAVRYYLARILHTLAENEIGPPPKDGRPVVITKLARSRLEEAEKLYRGLSQSDHDYTARASRMRMAVVRRMLGDADHPPSSYDTFEKAQMASLIQLGKLAQAEAKEAQLLTDAKTRNDKSKLDPVRAEIKDRQARTIALLERSRELITPDDSIADVTDVLLRLIYYYQLSDQPYQAAVLGEHVAYTIRGASGGKAALAGLFAINSYIVASNKVRGEGAAAARQADRERAVALARFLDERYPNDNATDAARHRLASLLVDDRQHLAALEILLRIRPSYAQIVNVRLFEGFLARELLLAQPKGDEQPLSDEQKLTIFNRAIADLARISRPAAVALDEDVRGYFISRYRLATLLFLQGRVDPAAERTRPGYNEAIVISEDMIRSIPTFNSMVEGEGAARKLNLDGQEMMLLAHEAQARAIYIRSRALIDTGNLDEAAKTLQPILSTVAASGSLLTPEMRNWAVAGGDDPDAAQKARIAQLAGNVDKTRVEVILAGFRLKVKQGKATEAAGMIDLLVKAGGTIEESLPLLELMGRELAAQMVSYRKEGKENEAKDLGAGLAVLLTKITTVPKMTPQLRLFVGQTLVNVAEYEKGIENLKQIPVPEFDGWETKKPEEIPAEIRGRILNQIRDYAIAQLFIGRALRESKKLDDAERLLVGIIGTSDKPGWGSGRLYFRRELAAVYEDKGAAHGENLKAANAEWNKALREWLTLFNIQRGQLQRLTPESPASEKANLSNAFADAFFDFNRCKVIANQQLLAKAPAKLQETYNEVGKLFADIEKQIAKDDWQPDVQHRYADFLKEVPPLAAPYKTAGGKLFLEKLPRKDN